MFVPPFTTAGQNFILTPPPSPVEVLPCAGINTSLLRDMVQSQYLEKWKQCSDQGRAATCTSAHPASNHWVPTGRYTSFGEYRFAIKARLNLLTTRTSRHRAGERVPDRSCRCCSSEQETLAHVMNHCPSHVGLLRKRHNILARLSKAIPAWKGRQYKEQVVPGDNLGLRPDLVVLDDTKEAFVIDVADGVLGSFIGYSEFKFTVPFFFHR